MQKQQRQKSKSAELPTTVSGASCSQVELATAVKESERLAKTANSRVELRRAMEQYEHCNLKASATNLVFSAGDPNAEIMVIGEAPGKKEDEQGKPFVGDAGEMLDRWFKKIGYCRHSDDPRTAFYITNVVPWRPPGNRDPWPCEIKMMKPFVERHIEIIKPKLLVLVGNCPCLCLLGKKGILTLKDHWEEYKRIPVQNSILVRPIIHPGYFLRGFMKEHEADPNFQEIQKMIEKIRADELHSK